MSENVQESELLLDSFTPHLTTDQIPLISFKRTPSPQSPQTQHEIVCFIEISSRLGVDVCVGRGLAKKMAKARACLRMCRVLYARGYLNSNFESTISRPALFDLIEVALRDTRDYGVRMSHPFPTMLGGRSALPFVGDEEERQEGGEKGEEREKERGREGREEKEKEVKEGRGEEGEEEGNRRGTVRCFICSVDRSYVGFEGEFLDSGTFTAVFAGIFPFFFSLSLL
jgi:hypothetical protein